MISSIWMKDIVIKENENCKKKKCVLSCYLGIKFFDRHRRPNHLQSKKATQLVTQQYFHHFLHTFIQFKGTDLGFCVLKRQKQIILIVCSMYIHSSVPATFHEHLLVQSYALQGPSQNTAYNYFKNIIMGNCHFSHSEADSQNSQKRHFHLIQTVVALPFLHVQYKASFSIVDISVKGLNIHVSLTCLLRDVLTYE